MSSACEQNARLKGAAMAGRRKAVKDNIQCSQQEAAECQNESCLEAPGLEERISNKEEEEGERGPQKESCGQKTEALSEPCLVLSLHQSGINALDVKLLKGK